MSSAPSIAGRRSDSSTIRTPLRDATSCACPKSPKPVTSVTAFGEKLRSTSAASMFKVRIQRIARSSGCVPVSAFLKPLGTGLIMSGYKKALTGTQPLERAIRWMRTLNMDAADVLRSFSPNAVTDVTGFGLFGHAHEVASRSGVRIVLESERLPAIDGALDMARKSVRTSGDPRNRDFAGRHLTLQGVPETLVALGYDPQTAGGLLVSLPQEQSPVLEAEFGQRGLFIRRIGAVEEGAGVLVR